MKQIVIGNDQRFSDIIVSNFKLKNLDYELFDLAFDTLAELRDALSSGNLFTTNRNIICYSLDLIESKEITSFIANLESFAGNFLGIMENEKKSFLGKLTPEIKITIKNIPSEKEYPKSILEFSDLVGYQVKKETLLSIINSRYLSYSDLQNIILLAQLGGLELNEKSTYLALSSDQNIEVLPWVFAGNIETGNYLAFEKISQNDSAIPLLSYLTKRYLDMLIIWEGVVSPQNAQDFFPGMNPYALSILIRDAKKFSPNQLKSALFLLAEFDIMVKSNPKEDVFSLLVFQLSSILNS